MTEGPSVDALEALVDPVDRARRIGEVIEAEQAVIARLSRLRREAVEELVSKGHSQTEIAELIGMTRARVGQLLAGGQQPERAFLGSGTLTVALGGKLEADKAEPGSVLSAEAFGAYERLAALARSLGLGTDYEVIAPPGMVTLNRTNLVVMCGPRLSPLVAQVLESDSALSFLRDDAGWYLRDTVAKKDYRSPLNGGGMSDIGYLARLPRPDGRGTFLYMAGIHAPGSGGAVHFLSENIAELYKEVKTKRFSVLIECDFDANNLITTSRQLTPIYKSDGI